MLWVTLEVGIKMKWGIESEKGGKRRGKRANKRARMFYAKFGCWSERVGG